MSAKPVILVIEGTSSAGDSLIKLLQSQPYHTIVTNSAADALAYAESSPIDLVICGIRPSEPHGRELLQTWRTRRPGTPFLVLGDQRSAGSAGPTAPGPSGHLDVPVSGETALSQISNWLRQSRRENNGAVADDDLPSAAPKPSSDKLAGIRIPPGTTLEDLERAAVEQALEQHQGNRTHAARELGISVRTLQRKLKAWGGAGANKQSAAASRQPANWSTNPHTNPNQPSAHQGNYRPRLAKI